MGGDGSELAVADGGGATELFGGPPKLDTMPMIKATNDQTSSIAAWAPPSARDASHDRPLWGHYADEACGPGSITNKSRGTCDAIPAYAEGFKAQREGLEHLKAANTQEARARAEANAHGADIRDAARQYVPARDAYDALFEDQAKGINDLADALNTPDMPSLSHDLLMAAANAAVSFAIGMLGGLIRDALAEGMHDVASSVVGATTHAAVEAAQHAEVATIGELAKESAREIPAEASEHGGEILAKRDEHHEAFEQTQIKTAFISAQRTKLFASKHAALRALNANHQGALDEPALAAHASEEMAALATAVTRQKATAADHQLQSSLVEWGKLQHGGVQESGRVKDQGVGWLDREAGQLNLEVEPSDELGSVRVKACDWPGLNQATRELLKTRLKGHTVGEAPPILRVHVVTELGNAWFEHSPGANAQVPVSGNEARVLGAWSDAGAQADAEHARVGAHKIVAKLYEWTYGELPLE